MYIQDFAVPKEDRLPFSKFMAYIARVDGKITIEEKKAIDNVILAMGLDEEGVKEVYDVMENGASLESLSKEFKSQKSPYLLIQEIITLAHIDSNYDETEKKSVREIASSFGIDEKRVSDLEGWVAEGISWREKGIALITP